MIYRFEHRSGDAEIDLGPETGRTVLEEMMLVLSFVPHPQIVEVVHHPVVQIVRYALIFHVTLQTQQAGRKIINLEVNEMPRKHLE